MLNRKVIILAGCALMFCANGALADTKPDPTIYSKQVFPAGSIKGNLGGFKMTKYGKLNCVSEGHGSRRCWW